MTTAGTARSWSTSAAFLFGVPAGLGLLLLLSLGPRESEVARYVSHPVEWVEVVLFCCALAALLAKVLSHRSERRALRQDLVPAWDGRAVPTSASQNLRARLAAPGHSLGGTFLLRRISGILDFVASRGSAAELDDQMRTLSDNDALHVESSYALIRFITWAIPILGFLGTVLGITEAIGGVTPETLEESLS